MYLLKNILQNSNPAKIFKTFYVFTVTFKPNIKCLINLSPTSVRLDIYKFCAKYLIILFIKIILYY